MKFVASAEDIAADDYNEGDWEQLNDVEKVLNGFGIALRDTAGTFKDADTIISELGENWQTYNSVQKNAIATAVAGTRQREVFYSTMENWEQVGKAARIAADSQGNAAQKMDAYTDSVQAAKNRITAAVEKLTQNAHLQGLLKDFYKVTAGMIDNIGKISLAIAGYLTLFKGKSLFTGLFGEGKFLNNAMYKMMDIGAGANKQGSLFGQIRNQYGNGQFKNMVNEMALINGQERAERNFFNKSNPTAFRDDQSRTMARNFLSLGGEAGSGLGAKASGPEGKVNSAYNKQIKASISKYVLGLDAAGNTIQMSNEMREAEMKGLQRLLTTEEKQQLTTEMLSEEQMRSAEVRAQAKMQDQLAKMSEEQRTKLTNEEKLVMQQKIQAEEQLKIAMDEYARTMKNASSAQKSSANKYIMYGTDRNQGMKDLGAGAISTAFTTAGALAPMMFSKGAGALGEKVGLDDSTSMFMSMFGMSAIGNLAAKNSKGILEGAAAFGKAAKSARLASNTLNASGGLIGGLNLMGSSAKAGTAALLGVEGAMAGIATAGLLVAGIVALMVAQAKEKAKEARMEAYKESKAKYDSLIDATATFNDSKYTHLAAGVDAHGNNVSLTDDEYQEFVDMSNRLAEAFPELVTYTDEVGNHFLSLGEDAQSLGTQLEAATAAAQRARDRDLLATREDVAKDYKKQVIEKSEDTNMLKNLSNYLNGTADSSVGKDEKAFIEKHSEFTVNKKGRIVNKTTGEAATSSDIAKLQNAANAAINDNTAAIKNLTSTYSDFGVAQARTMLGLNEDGSSVYDSLPDQTRQMIQSMVGKVAPDNKNYEETIGDVIGFANNFDWDTYFANMNNKATSAGNLDEYRQSFIDDFTKNWGANAMLWDSGQRIVAEQLGFEINDDGSLRDTRDVLSQINELATSKGMDTNLVESWGVNKMSVKDAEMLYQYLNEGKISAEATAAEVQGLIKANGDGKDALKARTEALKNVTEDNIGEYIDKLLADNEQATLENATEFFGGIGEETASAIVDGANEMLDSTQAKQKKNWDNKTAEEQQEARDKAADDVVQDYQDAADAANEELEAAKDLANTKPSDAELQKDVEAAQEKADAANAELEAAQELADVYKDSGAKGDSGNSVFNRQASDKLTENNRNEALDRTAEGEAAEQDNQTNAKQYQKDAIDDTVSQYKQDAEEAQEAADNAAASYEKAKKHAADLDAEAKEAKDTYNDLEQKATTAEKANSKNADDLRESADAARNIADAKEKEAKTAHQEAKDAKSTAKSTKAAAKSAKQKAQYAEKESDALKDAVDKGDGSSIEGDSELAQDAQKNWEKANKKRVKDAKSTGKELVKDCKATANKMTDAADSASLEGPIKKAQDAYQEFFSSIQDEDGNGRINTWNEMRQEFELINESITRTSNAMKEQNEYGHLSVQTALELLSADENYVDVMQVKNGQIQLTADAEEKMAQAQLKAAKAQISADIGELTKKKEKIKAIIAAGKASDSELQAVGALVEGQNEEINATQDSAVAAYNAGNAALVAAAGYDTLGNAAAAAAPKVSLLQKALDGATDITNAGNTNTKTNTVNADTYGDAPIFDKADYKVETQNQLTADQIADLEKEIEGIDKEIDLKKAQGDILDSVEDFKAGYTPGGGKDKSSGGGGGGGSGDKYTRLDHVKDILQAINKEYEQMIAYDKKFGVGNDINVAYYAKRKKYLQEEIELLKKKAKKDAKKKNKSDYYQDKQDLQQARIDLANLDDEKIQDKIDLLEARKELTGISYKYEIGLYKQLLKTADTEQERLEYEKKLIDAQRAEIQNQKEIAEAMKETLKIENAMMLAYKGISLTSKKTSTGYSLTSTLPGLDSITIKGTDGHTATGFENSLNKKRAAAVEKAKKKYKYVKVGKDDTGTLQYAYSNKNALTAEKNLAKKIMSANTSMSSDTLDADWGYITDSFGNRHWYPKSKANSTTVKNIKNYKKKGYYVAISVDDSGKLHFVKHKKTKKYTKKKAKSSLKAKVEQAREYANANIQHQDDGGSTQEHNSKVKKTVYDKAIDEALDWLKNKGTATPKEQIEAIDKNIDERAAVQRNVAVQLVKEMQSYTEGSDEYIELYGKVIEALEEEMEIEKEKYQKRLDLLDAAGLTNELTIEAYENLLAESDTIEEEWENQKKLNDAIKEYNKLLRDTLEYRYALYDNILEYESYTPSKDVNSQYMLAISAQQEILKKEMQDAKDQAEQYRKMAFDANVKAYMANGMSEAEAKDKAWKDSENDSDYQEAVNQYVEAFQKMGELVIRQFNDIADAIGRKLDKLEQERAEEWRSTWNGTWDNEGKLITKAQDKIKAYYGSVQAMQEQIKTEALATLKDVTYLTDEQVQEIVEKYNEAAVEVHQAMIDQMQDTVDYQDTLYNAVVDEVNDIIFNLEKQKELTEEMYDDEIESLQKKEDSIQRTNDLLEKQKALQDALNDRQRVYRAGIGWTYEANREAIKQAQKDLDTFKDEDRLNDLEKAKEDELNELDEKIKNWEDYLTMLEYQYNEYERIERQRLLMEVTGAEDMRGVHEFLVDDMENFTDYVKNNQSAFLENAIKAYTDYNTAFGGFLDDYEKNQLRLYDLLGEQKTLLNEEQFFKGNGTPLENFINNQLNSNWSDTTKELYDALTGAKYGDSPYSPGDTEQLAAAAAIKQRETNGEKVQVIDQNGKYYNSLAEFEKAQATNSDLKIAAYKSDNSKQVGGGAINTNALYDTNTGQAVTTATGAAVSNALATDNGKTTYIKVGDKAVDASKYSSITLKGDGTAVLKDEKTGAEITGELIQLGSNDYNKVTNTTTGGTSMADLYAKYGDGSIYAIGENDQILRTATGSYSNGVVTYGGGSQKSGYEIAGGNNGVVDTNSYTDVTRSTTDYGEDYVYKTSAGSDIIKMLAKYEGGNIALVDDGNGGVKVVAGNKSTVNGDTYSTSGGTNYQIVGDATSTAALDAAISARTGGKADSSTLSSGGSNIIQMTEKYDNVAYVIKNGEVALVGGNNSTIITDKKTGKQYYQPAGSTKKYEVVSTVEKNGKGYSEGIKNGPVTYTGLAMLHGSPMNPEYVLNSAQAGQLLYNMATKDMAYESIIEKYATTNNTTGDAFNINELNIQAESPQEFFDQLMQVVNGRYSTTKNRR